MPLWAQFVSLGLALFGFGLGVYNAWFAYRRDATRFVVKAAVEKSAEGKLFFKIVVSNRGNSALYIDSIWLTGGTKGTPPRWQLSFMNNRLTPIFKDPIASRDAGDFRTGLDNFETPISRGMFTVSVYTRDGAVRKAFCADLNQLGPDLLAAIRERRDPSERVMKDVATTIDHISKGLDKQIF